MDEDWIHLREHGFVVVREAIPTNELHEAREVFETLVDRQRGIWRQERGSDDPPEGAWETSAQPRLVAYDGLIGNGHEARAVEWLLARPRTVSQQIMAATAVPTQFMMMCNPVRDHGPAAWHRDIHPIDQAPVVGLQRDLLANRPGYLQWNLPLYDDAVLWVMPGSHARPNTSEENRLLAEDPRRPLPGALRVELAAGDGVVYTNLILHWGSDYSRQRRRTVHFGFRSFGGDLLPYVLGVHRRGQVADHLSADAQRLWSEHEQLYAAECDAIETVFRAAIDGDADRFVDGVADLHPGQTGRDVCVALLSKLAHKLRFDEHPERPGYGGDFTQEQLLAPRFSADDLDTLWRRFAPVDDLLKAPGGEAYVPGYQSAKMSYRFENMPEGLQPQDLTTIWTV